MKTEQPRNLGYMQFAVIEVANCQIAPKLLKYFSEVQPFVRKPSRKRPLAHSQAAGNVFHEHSSMGKHRRDRVLNLRAQLAHIWGIPGEYDHPRVRETYAKTIATCRKRGKHCGVGGLATRPDLVAEFVKMGARYVSTGTDLAFLLGACAARAKAVKEIKL